MATGGRWEPGKVKIGRKEGTGGRLKLW